jgi:site-specific recombinase XerD
MSTQLKLLKSVLADSIAKFIVHKRALGRKYSTEEKVFLHFDQFLLQRHIKVITEITPQIIDDFLAMHQGRGYRSYNHLFGTIRRLFAWLVLQGILPTSPVHGKFRRPIARKIPYIFDQKAAIRLLKCAAKLHDNPRAKMRGATYRTIFALLYGLGLRVGEVSRLCCGDIDFEQRLLVIRQTKFSKSRLVPFGPRIGKMLGDYLTMRRYKDATLCSNSPVFSFTKRGHISPYTITQTFHSLLPRLGLKIPFGVSTPRLHCLRHSFAVGTLLRWYRSGIDPQSRLLCLSTFMGHVSPESTAVYLTISNELLQEANNRFEKFAKSAIKEGSL